MSPISNTVYIYSIYRRCNMGFPSPAADYVEERLSLDKRLIVHPSATYMMISGTTYLRAGIIKGAMLIVDSSLTPKDGSLLVCAVDGEFRIMRYRTHPQPYLENPENGKREPLPLKEEASDTSRPVFGVITYSINDARSGEFDDSPVI
nr:S24 family peptidase [Enterobacter asburiae]